jgi:hypothetical protein
MCVVSPYCFRIDQDSPGSSLAESQPRRITRTAVEKPAWNESAGNNRTWAGETSFIDNAHDPASQGGNRLFFICALFADQASVPGNHHWTTRKA